MKIELSKADKIVLTCIISSILAAVSIAFMTSCGNNHVASEFKLNLADVIETGYGNTVDGDSMYWAIYEEWDNDCTRHLLYMDKDTFEALEAAVEEYNKAGLKEREILNNRHKFTLLRDSKGLHMCSIR